MKQTIQTMQLGAALSVAVALAACGGGNGDEEVTIFQPGEVVTFAATLEDGSTQESHYLVHGVTANGELHTHAADASEPFLDKTTKMSGGPRNRPPLAMVALPLESAEQTNTPRLAALRDFYQQLWQGIATRRGPGADIAAEIGAFESDVGALYDDYQRSEFASVKDYVAFYEQVGENPFFDAQEAVEEELVEFFYRTGWPQGAWLQALQRQQWDWPRFLQLMAQRGDTFFDLLSQYNLWSASGEVGMEALIARYAAITDLKKSAATQFQSKAQKIPDADLFYVTNKSWGVRINTHEQSSVAILSSKDKVISSYQRIGEKTSICPVKLMIKGRLGHVQANLEWQMKYVEEKHARLPGTYFSSLGMEFFKAEGYEGQVLGSDLPSGIVYRTGGDPFLNKMLIKSLSVNVEIKDLKNVGTEAAPRPGLTARVKITPSFIFNSPWVRNCEVR